SVPGHIDRHVVALHPRLYLHMAEYLHGKQPRFKLAILLTHKGSALARYRKGLFGLSVLRQAQWTARRRKVFHRRKPVLCLPRRTHCDEEHQALSYTGSHSTHQTISVSSHVTHARFSLLPHADYSAHCRSAAVSSCTRAGPHGGAAD